MRVSTFFYYLKATVLLTLVILICVSTGQSNENTNLQGVWEIVSGEMTTNDSTFSYAKSEHFNALKFISKTHWTVIGHDTKKGLFWAHAGTYTIEGDNFVQTLLIHENPKNIGKKSKYEFELDGDKWIFKGHRINEIWKRIE